MTRSSLETVLKVRELRRQRLRQAVAQLAHDQQAAAARVQEFQTQQTAATALLQSAMAAGNVDVDRAAAVRYHLAVLQADGANVARQQTEAAATLAHALDLLRTADAQLQAVERLRERQIAEQRRDEQRREDRDATDLFSAMQTQLARSLG